MYIYFILYPLYLTNILLVSIQITTRRDLVESSDLAQQLMFLYCIFSHYTFFVTWRWPTMAETCQPNKYDTKTVVFWCTHSLVIYIKHNWDDASKNSFVITLKRVLIHTYISYNSVNNHEPDTHMAANSTPQLIIILTCFRLSGTSLGITLIQVTVN